MSREVSQRSLAGRLPIRLLILDVDGVLTDGRLQYTSQGEVTKTFHVRDGYGIKAVLDAGIDIAIVSGRRCDAVDVRARDLGIRHVYQGVSDKIAIVQRIASELGVPLAACACVGDDTPDVPVMQAVGIAYAVADAHPDALHAAHRVTRLRGGHGAVREVCDALLAHALRDDARAAEVPAG